MKLRSKRPLCTGFTDAEVQKMEQILNEPKDQLTDVDFCKELAGKFNRSNNRAGKLRLKWTEIRSWFKENQQRYTLREPSFVSAEKLIDVSETLALKRTAENPEMPEDEKHQDMLKNLEFEARSLTDGAWYDVHSFLSHRFLSSGEIEVFVRYDGFGAEEDEWVNVKNDVRERSVALEHYECQKLKVGDQVLCFQEMQDEARHFDAHVIGIQRRLHDIRGCRCLFLIKYDHDNTQERVSLRRLCCRPDLLQQDQIVSN